MLNSEKFEKSNSFESLPLLSEQKPVKLPLVVTSPIPSVTPKLEPEKPKPSFKLPSFLSVENLLFLCIFAVIVTIKFSFFPFVSGDYSGFLKNWIRVINEAQAKTGGLGFEVFSTAFFDYTPAYVYLLWVGTLFKSVSGLVWIKSISFVFEILLSYFAAKIVHFFKPGYFKLAFLVIFALPAVVFNGSWWGQCDVVYTTFVLATLHLLLKKNYLWSFVAFGLAISFKLQAIFFAPVFAVLLFTKNIKFRTLVLLPIVSFVVYFITILPAHLAGRPLIDFTNPKESLLTIYANQGNAWKGLAMGAIPSIYQWFDNEKYDYFYFAGVWLTVGVLLAFCLIVHKSKLRDISNKLILKISLVSTLMAPFLLPKMHERYMYIAEILAVVYAFVFPKKFWVGVVMTVISLSIYVSGVIGGPIPNLLHREFNTLWIIGILTFLIWDIVKNKDS
jgi:Gpi18-like mannosyltransferase